MLKLQNIRKTFNPGTVNEKPALCGVDLDLAAGDFATIVGSNGAGKSTLFNAIAGSFMVDSGRIELDGKDSPVGLLSGGQRQALTMLMATMVTPKLLLLDEHTAALDPATADKVLDLTRRVVAERHITCLMVTHNMHQALDLGNRTLMMDAGKIVLDISGEERAHMTVDGLLDLFSAKAGRALDNDRILTTLNEKE